MSRFLVVIFHLIIAVYSAPQFDIQFSSNVETSNLTGRAFVFISIDANSTNQPRDQVGDGPDSQQIFGRDFYDLKPNKIVSISLHDLGYPVYNITDIPLPKQYFIQAVIQRYTYYDRSDGAQIWLPRPEINAEGLFTAPKTLYSAVMSVNLDTNSIVNILCDQIEGPYAKPNDTDYIKHVSIKSNLLTEFWGTSIYLEACILLPYGFDTHPNASYPLFLYQGHYHRDWATPVAFSETPPNSSLTGYSYVAAQYAYYLYLNWTDPSGIFKDNRGMIMTIKHPTPYYDDSYSVNSANLGPYGEAIMTELIPFVEHKYRGIGQEWARTVYGGSTGGWESIATQIYYPKMFNGAWTFCPDPVSFNAYSSINIYENKNAYYLDSFWKKTPRASQRDDASNQIYPGYGEMSGFGWTTCTVEETNIRELVFGENSRSTGQYDIWEAVFSPLGPKGYPRRLYNKRTGEIDPITVKYWKENYDLAHILSRDWDTIGKYLVNKIHIYVGMTDTFFLNDAVYYIENVLEATTDPYYNGTIEFGQHDGRGFEHCWSGGSQPNSIGRLTINERVIPQMVDHIVQTSPNNADFSWRY